MDLKVPFYIFHACPIGFRLGILGGSCKILVTRLSSLSSTIPERCGKALWAKKFLHVKSTDSFIQ